MSAPMTAEEKQARFDLVQSLITEGNSVARIARDLGTGEQYLRDWMRDYRAYGNRAIKPKTVERPCINCRKPFQSPDRVRIQRCDKCKSSNQDASPYEPNPGGDTGRRTPRRR